MCQRYRGSFLGKGERYNTDSITFHWLMLLPYSAPIYINSQLQLRDVRTTIDSVFLGVALFILVEKLPKFWKCVLPPSSWFITLSQTTRYHTLADNNICVHYRKNLQTSVRKFSVFKDIGSCGFWSGRH